MKEKRKHLRTSFKCRVRVTHPSIGERIVYTRDISEGGLFLVKGDGELPVIGEVLTGQVIDGPPDAPEVKMQVTRVVEDGIGLEFLLEDD